jgi:hypothetical protein
MIHTEITPVEQDDRLAIRELIDAYAHCAERRDAEGHPKQQSWSSSSYRCHYQRARTRTRIASI